jgi:uridine kinase
MKNHIIVSVSGASGSGKSVFCKQLTEKLGNCYNIPLDRYYKKELPKIISPLNGKNYDDWNHPSAIDTSLVLKELDAALKSDKKYVILDGAFLLCIDELRERADIKIFVDSSIEMRFYRRIKRNLTFNLTLEEIADYYLNCARYREAEYAVPSKKYADIIIDNENGFGNQAELVFEKIKAFENKLI